MENDNNHDELRQRIIGLGEYSFQKSYYPQLQMRLAELERFKSLLNESSDAIFVFEADSLTVIEANKNAALFCESGQEILIGMSIHDIFSADVYQQIEKKMIHTTFTIESVKAKIETGSGRNLPVEITVKKAAFHKKFYLVVVARDIRERLKSEKKLRHTLREKEILLQEIHHRVKNNLQVISSLLDLQVEKKEGDNPYEILQKARNRVRAMALIHEGLYKSEKLSSVDFKEYVVQLVTDLKQFYLTQPIKEEIVFHRFSLDVHKAIPCALIINELATYLFKMISENKDKQRKKIKISFTRKKNLFVLEFGANIKDQKNRRDQLSMELIHILTNQLGGVIDIEEGKYFLVTISFGAGSNHNYLNGC